jgi:hypothetical protein
MDLIETIIMGIAIIVVMMAAGALSLIVTGYHLYLAYLVNKLARQPLPTEKEAADAILEERAEYQRVAKVAGNCVVAIFVIHTILALAVLWLGFADILIHGLTTGATTLSLVTVLLSRKSLRNTA